MLNMKYYDITQKTKLPERIVHHRTGFHIVCLVKPHAFHCTGGELAAGFLLQLFMCLFVRFTEELEEIFKNIDETNWRM